MNLQMVSGVFMCVNYTMINI